MKAVRLALILACITISCAREDNFLEKVAAPVKPQSPKVTPEPTAPPPPDPTPAPKKYSKNLPLKVANTQTTIPAVDILWVIDTSGSMGDDQQNVINNTSAFMNGFTSNSQLRWKMGLIATGENTDDKAQPIPGSYPDPFVGFTPSTKLDYQTQNPVPIFQDAVARMGILGSNIEHVFNPVLHNLRRYPSFLTKDAYLALIIVTDEDEGGERPSSTSAASFVNQLAALKGGDKNKILVYGVYETFGDCGSGFNYTFSRYWNLSQQVTATKYPLCSPNFGKTLGSIGEDLITKISTIDPVILLDSRPIPTTIKVTYKNQVLPGGFKDEGGYWIYDPVYNVIKITNPSVLDSGVLEIKVEFDIDPRYN